MFTLNNTCSYVLASNDCNSKKSQYSIVADHETRYGYEGHTFIKAIRIKLQNTEYRIDENFYVSLNLFEFV